MAAAWGGGEEIRALSANVVGRSAGGGCAGFEARDENSEEAAGGDEVANGLLDGIWVLVEAENGF